MKKMSLLGAAAALLAFGAIGCQNTAEGAAEDTSKNVKAVETGAAAVGREVADETKDAARAVETGVAEATKGVKEGTEAVTAPLLDTPRIKTEILADTQIAEAMKDTSKGFEINVESDADKIVLKGSVPSNAIKKRAGELATKQMQEMNAKQTLDNQLMVSSR